MKFIWLVFFIEVGILTLFKPMFSNYQRIATTAVLIHIIFSMIILMGYTSKKKVLFLSAFLSRVAFLFWDLYASHIYSLPNSGYDTGMYYSSAVRIGEDLSLLNQNIHGGLYSQIIGGLYHFIGPQRITGQYINVLLGLSVVFIIYKIMMLLSINSKLINVTVLIAAFFPNSLIMSAIFLREIFPTFFVAASLYYFVKWFIKPKMIYILLCFIMIGLGSMFHSGVIGIFLGYAFGFLFYKKELNAFRFNNRTVASFAILVIITSLGFTVFSDQLFSKFNKIDDISDIYSQANSRYGGSAYLKGLEITTPLQLAIFGPVKTIFFFTVPLPMNWRGFMDIFTFFSDSMLYLYTLVFFIKNRKKLGGRRTLAITLLIMLIGAGIIFGIGVSNAGTAIRHRQKLVPVFIVLLGVMMDGKHHFKALQKVSEPKKP